MNPIKPDHYLNENGQDLFEQWYHRYPLPTFLAVMECIEERYRFRASRKNGEEDLRKAQEVRDRKLAFIRRFHIETSGALEREVKEHENRGNLK